MLSCRSEICKSTFFCVQIRIVYQMDNCTRGVKLSRHKCHKFTLTPTSMTACFISKDMSNRLFFSFRDRIISFFQNVHIQSFEPSIKSFLDRLLSVFWIGQFHRFVMSSFVFLPSIFCLLGHPINNWIFHYQLFCPIKKWTV